MPADGLKEDFLKAISFLLETLDALSMNDMLANYSVQPAGNFLIP